MTTALFLLRCCQIGLQIRDLELMTVGMVTDLFIESSNDSCDYCAVAGQEEFDSF